MWEENQLGGYVQNNQKDGPLENLKNLNQKAGETLLNIGGQALETYDKVERTALPMRRPFIQKTADWVDNNLTSFLKKWEVTEPYAEKAGDIAGLTTDLGLEIFTPGIEELAVGAATVGGGALPSYGKNVLRRAATELPNYNRILNGVFDGSWKRVDGERVFVTPEGVRIDANNIDLNPNIMQMSGSRVGSDGVPQLARMYFARSGLRNGVFDLNTWRHAGSDRNVMELFQTRWNQVGYVKTPHKQFTSTRDRLIQPFLEEYGPYLEKFDIDPSTINLHHIFGVNLSAPLYDGLQYGSKEWTDMTNLLNDVGLFPGAPATSVAKRSNLTLALQEPHDLLHNQFFKDTIGVKGEKFFTPERMELIRSGIDGRKQVAKEYSEIVKQGETLIQRGMDQIQNVFGLTDIPPERLADAFSESLGDGTTNIFKDGYKIESVNQAIKDLVFDIQIDEIINPLKPQLENINPKALNALQIVLESENPISAVKALKEAKYGRQLELVFNQIPENKLKQLMNIRRGSTPGNTGYSRYSSPSDKGLE